MLDKKNECLFVDLSLGNWGWRFSLVIWKWWDFMWYGIIGYGGVFGVMLYWSKF